jgi:hypothetical protein
MSDRGLRSLGIRHFHKCEPSWLSCVAIGNDINALHAPVGGECSVQVVLRCLITEISDKYVGHSFSPFDLKLSLSDSSETNLNKKERSAAERHSMINTDARKDTSVYQIFEEVRFRGLQRT